MANIKRIFPPREACSKGALFRPEFVNADVVINTESIMEYGVPLLIGYDAATRALSCQNTKPMARHQNNIEITPIEMKTLCKLPRNWISFCKISFASSLCTFVPF